MRRPLITNAAWTPELMDAALPRGVRPVIGTSGLPQEFIDDLAAVAAFAIEPFRPPLDDVAVPGLSLAQVVAYRPKFSKCVECTAYIEPEIDGLLKRLATLREML